MASTVTLRIGPSHRAAFAPDGSVTVFAVPPTVVLESEVGLSRASDSPNVAEGVPTPATPSRPLGAPSPASNADVVSLPLEDWLRLVKSAHGHHVRLGLVPDTKPRRPLLFVAPAPLWVRIVTLGRVRTLPTGPSLRGIKRS